ncbi:helix-turn-helix domain-containing protein [Pararhizobium sp. PWRC1-1]|uniref:helix-turn-helix domain-containing protein n=1 Tax=Pararhizobium sp. PWRC1-1 TaxID=2804566 RepID=UPI003CF9B19D
MLNSTAPRMPHPVDVHVGSRIRFQRMMMKMSQTDLGEAVGVTFQQIQKYEKGTNRVSASRLQQIADVLRVSVTFFFEGKGAQVTVSGEILESDELSLFLSTSEGLTLNQAFAKIADDQVRRKIVGLVKTAAKTSDG